LTGAEAHTGQMKVIANQSRTMSMDKHLLILNGHPDPRPHRYCAALCEAYAQGATDAGWQTRRLSAGDFADTLDMESDPPAIRAALEDFRWAGRLAIVFPLLLDAPPPGLTALLKRAAAAQGARLATIVVTMSLPGFLQRTNYRADRTPQNLITLPGVRAQTPTFIGCVETITDAQRQRWLATLRADAFASLHGQTKRAA
jgi:putative NADPH-quinone reductase